MSFPLQGMEWGWLLLHQFLAFIRHLRIPPEVALAAAVIIGAAVAITLVVGMYRALCAALALCIKVFFMAFAVCLALAIVIKIVFGEQMLYRALGGPCACDDPSFSGWLRTLVYH